ncbi:MULTISPECIES: glutathione S-transferase N-terminal domain-containing protein [Vibrio]|uniref:Glutaredoxin 2 n=2 Tax=Vibrio TaxID=662 RepID=A0A1N6M8P1_9VIBR|nr:MULTISPECIES: glutathione S-transferase N-terminal domain-containing protein [Vibrio]QMV16322.1 glutaredoxin 2 [Vibrio spartinae]SHE49402.1 Glutathione S-transferase, N-terminal domain [Vibrio gazogenes DSM 21264] [Vibrio gazogenes DSM 21264 = NBRC 103151]SIO95821.1 glutaredoxin 2 [Vibrio spartinae]SJN53079.1 glutaredoxin 2 [Vibrio gazogenes]
MKLLINVIRNLLGYIIIAVDLITRGPKKKRDPEKQKEINQALTNLSLYQFSACPFCTKTRRAMYKLNLPIEKRDVSEGSKYRTELLEGGGKVRVPCLRIEQDGNVEWMYESSDIINYLEKRFA